MGWGSGENYRNEVIGYSHIGVCSEPGCDEEIDKGLYFTCGGLEGVNGQRGCGRHFCGSHLFYVTSQQEEDEGDEYDPEFDECENAGVCSHCVKRMDAGLSTGMEDITWQSQ